MNRQVDERIRQSVQNAAKDGRLSCTAARRLARELQVTAREIGDACNDLKIKIYSCELGCF